MGKGKNKGKKGGLTPNNQSQVDKPNFDEAANKDSQIDETKDDTTKVETTVASEH